MSSISDESYVGIEQAVAPDVDDEPAVALVADEPFVADVPANDPLADEPVVAPFLVPAEGVADEPDQGQELPKKQKFRNLGAALDESNYKDLPSQRKRTFKYSYAMKIMQISWETIPNDASLRQFCASNILKHIPGPQGVAKRVQTFLESFKLFFTNEMQDMIVRYTSDCIQLVLKRFAPVLQNGKSLYFRLVDHIDIKVFFGILYLRSAFHSNMRNIRDLRFHESAHDIFAAAMSWNRFHFICKFITLMISQHATIDGKMTNMHA